MRGEQKKEIQPVLCWAVATPPELKALRAVRDLNLLVEHAPFSIFSYTFILVSFAWDFLLSNFRVVTLSLELQLRNFSF